ncbi:MAG: hypothetical protein AAF790_00800 [Planctomycetota bacterium]
MFETIYLYAALAGGIFLAIQFGMMLLGMGDDGAADSGFDGNAAGDVAGGDVGLDTADASPNDEHWTQKADGDLDVPDGKWFFELFSLRSLAGGALFFGLTGKTALVYGVSETTAALYATAAGVAALYAVYWVFKQVFRLQVQGNEDVRNAIGLPARVYLPVPPSGEGAGKVQFKMQGRLVEYQAVNDGAERLATGRQATITGVVSSNTVSVQAAEQA